MKITVRGNTPKSCFDDTTMKSKFKSNFITSTCHVSPKSYINHPKPHITTPQTSLPGHKQANLPPPPAPNTHTLFVDVTNTGFYSAVAESANLVSFWDLTSEVRNDVMEVALTALSLRPITWYAIGNLTILWRFSDRFKVNQAFFRGSLDRFQKRH